MLNRNPGRIRAYIAKVRLPAGRRRLHSANGGRKAHRFRALSGIHVPRQNAAIRADMGQGLSGIRDGDGP